jgi:hypothetical protein
MLTTLKRSPTGSPRVTDELFYSFILKQGRIVEPRLAYDANVCSSVGVLTNVQRQRVGIKFPSLFRHHWRVPALYQCLRHGRE